MVRQKTSFSISLISVELTIFLILFKKHNDIDIADPSSMKDACQI